MTLIFIIIIKSTQVAQMDQNLFGITPFENTPLYTITNKVFQLL